jgi:hypothetical protein
VRPPYNVSVLNAEAALFALEHADEYAARPPLICASSASGCSGAARLPGVHPWPSEANMVLVRVPDAAATFDGMKARGVLVKNVSALHPLLANCLRLTVGTPDEVTLMMAALRLSLCQPYDQPHRRCPPKTPTNTEIQNHRAVNLDGTGRATLSTGIGFFDHMLDQIARHGLIDLDIECRRRPAHRRPPHGGRRGHHAGPGGGQGRGRQEGHHAATAMPTCRWTRRCRAW